MLSRPPGTLPAAGVPSVPYTPDWPPVLPIVLLPLTQVHSFEEGVYSQRSLRSPSVPTESKPYPPKSQRLPLLSIHPIELPRAPGTFPDASVPSVPYTPSWLAELLPPIQVHSFEEGLYFHRSLSAPAESHPPKSQRLPLLSLQFTAMVRLPGMFPAAGVPSVPYTPDWLAKLLPPIQVHSLVETVNFHRSLRSPFVPAESKPLPPNTQRLPLLSLHIADA